MLKLHVPWEDTGWNFYAFGVYRGPERRQRQPARGRGRRRAPRSSSRGAELGLDALFKRDQKPRVGIDLSTGIGTSTSTPTSPSAAGEDFNVVEQAARRRTMCTVPCTDPAPRCHPTDDLAARHVRGHPPLRRQDPGGVRRQLVAQVQRQRPVHDRRRVLLQPARLRRRLALSRGCCPTTGRHAAAELLLHRAGTTRRCSRRCPAPYSWNYTTFTFSTLGQSLRSSSFVSRLDYSLTVLTHLSFEAFAAAFTTAPGRRVPPGHRLLRADRAADPTMPANCVTYPAACLRSGCCLDLGVALRMKI